MLQRRSLGSVEILSVEYDAVINALLHASSAVKKEHPDVKQVLLFGSFARGDYTPFSDIDILIVIKETEINFLERKDTFVQYFKSIPFDVNILVYSSKEIESLLQKEN